MKANKITVKIEVETLSIDAVPAKLYELIEALDKNENTNGMLCSEDGDMVKWNTTIKEVTF
jgi:hypothetical protein